MNIHTWETKDGMILENSPKDIFAFRIILERHILRISEYVN